MARPKRTFRAVYKNPTMTYLKPEQRRALEAACEQENIPVSTWLRRLIAAELGRISQQG